MHLRKDPTRGSKLSLALRLPFQVPVGRFASIFEHENRPSRACQLKNTHLQNKAYQYFLA